jgi:hypothetical protein
MQNVTVSCDITSYFADFCGCRKIDPRVTLDLAKQGRFNSTFMQFCKVEDVAPREAWEILSAQDWSDWGEPQGISEQKLKEFNRCLSRFVGELTTEQMSDVLCSVLGTASPVRAR